MLAPLTGPDGVCYAPINVYMAGSAGYVTNKAKNVDLAVKVMDSFYDPNVHYIPRFGEEGVNWTRDPAILAKNENYATALGIYDSLTMVMIDDPWGKPQSKHWNNIQPFYFSQEETMRTAFLPYNPDLPASVHGAVSYLLYWPKHPQFLLPRNLLYTYDDGVSEARFSTDINEYIDQSVAEFIISTRDINNDAVWNAYIRELDNMGLQQWINLTQTAYNQSRQ